MCLAETIKPPKPSTTPNCSQPTGGARDDCHPACTIASQTIAVSPADRARTKIGVGEEVILTITGNPATWAITGGAGTLSPNAGARSSVKFTAGDAAGSVTVTATGAGCGCANSITLTIVRPTGWSMKKKPDSGIKHVNGHPDCGWLGIMFVHPNDVNFYNVESREKDSLSVGSGVYHPSHNGKYHGSYPLPDRAGAWFVMRRHIDAAGSQVAMQDKIYSGYPSSSKTGAAPPFTTGNYYWEIVWQWRVVGSANIHDFPTVRQEHEIFADGKCESRKGGHKESALYSDPTGSF